MGPWQEADRLIQEGGVENMRLSPIFSILLVFPNPPCIYMGITLVSVTLNLSLHSLWLKVPIGKRLLAPNPRYRVGAVWIPIGPFRLLDLESI